MAPPAEFEALYYDEQQPLPLAASQ